MVYNNKGLPDFMNAGMENGMRTLDQDIVIVEGARTPVGAMADGFIDTFGADPNTYCFDACDWAQMFPAGSLALPLLVSACGR